MNLLLDNADATNGNSGEDIRAILLFAGVTYLALFAWLTISGWARQRRKERESFYRHEVEKKIIEAGGVSTEQLAELRRDEENRRWVQRREGLKLAGLVTMALGIGLFVAIQFLIEDKPVHHLAWIPIGIGAVILLYVYMLCPDSMDKDKHRNT